MNSEDSLRSEIFYYLREKYYGTCLSIVETYLGTVSIKNLFFVIIKEYSLIKLKKVSIAIRQLNSLKGNDDYKCSVLTLLKIAYESEKEKDITTIKELEKEIQKSSNNINDKDLYLLGIILISEGIPQQFRKYLKQSNYDSMEQDLISLFGWLEYYDKHDVAQATKYFNKISSNNDEKIIYPDIYLGKVRMYQDMRYYDEMIQILSECLSHYSSFMPGHIELTRSWMINRNWEKVYDSIQTANLVSNGSVFIHFVEVIYTILIKGQYSLYESVLMDLYDSIETFEKGNVIILEKICKLLLSVMLDNDNLIDYTEKFINKLLEIDESIIYKKLKCQFLLKKKYYKESFEIAKDIMNNYTGDDPEILLILVQCYIKLGKKKDARYQLDFSKASNNKVQDSSMYYYLEAYIIKMEGKPYDVIYSVLCTAIEKHTEKLYRINYGINYFIEINCDFLIDIGYLLFEISPLTPTKTYTESLKQVVKVISLIHDNFPGIDRAVYLLAKGQYLQCEIDEAENLLNKCIEKSHQIAEIHLLMAQIQVEKKNLDSASKYLDIGLSLNFKVKDHPLYYLTKALLLKKSNQIDQSITLLKQAMKLPTFDGSIIEKPDSLSVSDSDRIAIYLELINSLQIQNNIHEADIIMNRAMQRWKGKPEEQQLFLMSAQLKISRGDCDGGIDILNTITPDQPNYQAAQIKLAEIYLQEKKDSAKFAKCYKNILSSNPSVKTYIMLGDAYMSIQEPLKAIEVYETAMKKNSKDFMLAEKIGTAYVKCFMFHKAINFYETALKNSKQSKMRLCYVELLLKMGNYEKCEKVLKEGFEKYSEVNDINTLKDHISYYMMLSKLHLEINNWEEAANDLGQAKRLQSEVISKATTEGYNMQEEILKASNICSKIADLYNSKREYSKAAEMYKEAVAMNGQDIKSMIALARIYMATGRFQQCHTQCQAILTRDRYNDDATLMMADLQYQNNKPSEALIHYTQLLDRNPSQYHALARCIELCKRTGDIEQAEKYLKSVVDINPRATMDCGYNYCKGLNEWYSGEPNAALQAFNRAKRDIEWRESAIYNIIEICLNPDNEIIGGEIYDVEGESNNEESNRYYGAKSAQQFLDEIKGRPQDEGRYELMSNFILMSTTNKASIQVALNNFLNMLVEKEPSTLTQQCINVGAILGSARCYLALKQQPKAKQQLKSILNYPWNLEEADYLQQCWLLLADIYIKQGKGEQASNVIKTIIKYNSSCIKAYELMAYTKEKEQKFYEAAFNYEKAWKLSKCRNVNVGFKLAYTHMKCKKFFHSIHICQQILEKYPDYPRIKTEILDKSRAGLRI
ncbi:Tetratricopeptide repeat protein 21B [Strongyloides ratti]|uniref:Tetratricopeptide repeat protein 21B n=1 Tax=Strongyloides ratti TaxID=34506 RepID=A0A090LES5_STRRB|nr:Tetratricopeptide repeat protein 21B [Strongyloides ratti]CEF66648.1 Tetratricopeptide repeat protein 21B [Strongyloides ratti]